MGLKRFSMGVCFMLTATLLAGCPPAAKLSVSAKSHHFGVNTITQEYETTWAFQVWNSGSNGTTLVFEATASEPWIELDVPKTTSTGPDDKVTVTVTINRDYSEAKSEVPDFASGVVTVTASVGEAEVGVTTAPEYFTEVVSDGGELDGLALTFTPNGGPNFYEPSKSEISEFPTPIDAKAAAYPLDFAAYGDPIRAGLFGGKKISYYGEEYDTLYISSDGWISFGAPGNSPISVAEHFANAQVSGLPVDALAPGATVSYLQDSDKLVITYQNAPTSGAPGFNNNFQVELFFDGTLQVSFLDVDPAVNGVIGLSLGIGDGTSAPEDFLESDFSEFNTGTLKTF